MGTLTGRLQHREEVVTTPNIIWAYPISEHKTTI